MRVLLGLLDTGSTCSVLWMFRQHTSFELRTYGCPSARSERSALAVNGSPLLNQLMPPHALRAAFLLLPCLAPSAHLS
jgi:hypothetical protein